MDSRREMGPTAARVAFIGALLAAAGTALLFLAAWAAPIPTGVELSGVGRLGLPVARGLRQAWYALACPAAALAVPTMALGIFGRRAPVGCGYAVAVGGILAFAVSLVLAGLTLAVP